MGFWGFGVLGFWGTAIAIGLLFLNGPLGIGAVVGLVIFQIVFVVNVGRVLVSSGLQ